MTCKSVLCRVSLAMALCLSLGTAWADEALDRRLQSVATLIESSSVARQIDGSGDATARAKRDSARLLHREARARAQAGDAAAAGQLLDSATREMMSGARLARPEQVHGQKDRLDLDARLASARALLGAQQRIVQEKQAGADATATTGRIEALLARAEGEATAGRVAAARPIADEAYLLARVSIESMRRGDTLVRSLNFASAQEEYVYEIDRNDTHRMLVQVVLADRQDARSMMQGFVDRAAELRRGAEALAGRGDHAGAIRELESSTRELVRAIRAGGIYIPG